ncbi:uncharacterized protein LOC135839651 isoform X1 [Planococcus citri]|uniref:uncharacterized protein LOC135839651 isoform X1 n=2 Tax=Planococcus citri TaxID=170843 RepID=UPI0031F85541
MNIPCTICRKDLFTCEDNNKVISSTKCGHVYHQRCLFQWMERKENAELTKRVRYLENTECFMLEQLNNARQTLRVMRNDNINTKLADERLRNETKKLEGELATRKPELRKIKQDFQTEKKRKAVLAKRVKYLENTECFMLEQLNNARQTLRVMRNDNINTKLAAEKLRTENQKLAGELATRKTELRKIKQDFQTEK